MKTRTPRSFQVVYRRKKVWSRPDARPHRLLRAADSAADTSGLILYGQA